MTRAALIAALALATFTGDDLLALANPPEIGVVQLCG